MTRPQTPNLKSGHRSSSIAQWPLVIGLLFAFALRLYRLDAQSIWIDEGTSLHLATSSLAEIVANRAANIHPPLYFFLLKGWVALTGTSIFSARFLSATFSLLQVGAVYAVSRRWLGRPTACVAACLIALSPLSIIYAQEIRSYALLPLVYLALLSITHQLTHKHASHRRTLWLLLGLVEIAGLHLHYIALTVVAYAGGWLLLTFWREKRWGDLRRWSITHLLVCFASLPWLVTVLTHWPAVQMRIQKGQGLTEPVPPDYLLSQVWVFHLTGLAGAVGRPFIRLLAYLALLLLAALLLFRLARPATRRPMARLMAHWLIPLGLALLVWIVRPFSHPRYIALYAPGLILLAAYAIHPAQPTTPNPLNGLSQGYSLKAAIRNLSSSPLPFALAISLILLSFLGLRAYFFDPAFAKDDMRSVARYLEEEARPDDLILIPSDDWSLTFVYRGEAPIEMARPSDKDRMWADLARWTAHRRRVFIMDYPHGIGVAQRGVIPFALEKEGTLLMRQNFDDIALYLYELNRSVEPPTLAPVDARFGPLTLTQGWVEATADTALTLALRWRLLPTPRGGGDEGDAQRYLLTLRLLDVDGWALTTHDGLLLDRQNRPTDYWSAIQETTTYHVLPVPPDIPPLTYTLTLGLYEQAENDLRSLDVLDDQGAPQGHWLDLATVRLTSPMSTTGTPYGTTSGVPPLAQPVNLADGLQLLGFALDRSTLGPGHPLVVTLRWQASRSPLPDLQPRLALTQAGQELAATASAPALGRYPTDRWQAGEMVVEHRRLVVPPTAANGPADVVLTLEDRRLLLGQVEIIAGKHIFTPPSIAYPLDVRFGQVARLIGYDLPSQTLVAGEPITLTLYWEALGGAAGTDYTVFTHILTADGRLVGQHDGPPANGTRPTAGWIAHEIITDRHTMTFREIYTGPARIEVGLYDPTTLDRVPTEEGETFTLLPTVLTILEH